MIPLRVARASELVKPIEVVVDPKVEPTDEDIDSWMDRVKGPVSALVKEAWAAAFKGEYVVFKGLLQGGVLIKEEDGPKPYLLEVTGPRLSDIMLIGRETRIGDIVYGWIQETLFAWEDGQVE